MANDEPISISFSLIEAKEIHSALAGGWHRHGPVRQFIRLLDESIQEEENKPPSDERKARETVQECQELCLNCSNTKGSHGAESNQCPANEGRMDFMKDDLSSTFSGSGVYELFVYTEGYKQRSWTRALYLPVSESDMSARLNREGNIIMRKP